MNTNKIVDEAIERTVKTHLRAGHYPEVQYKQTDHMTGFSLFEYVAVSDNYRRGLHYMLLDRGYAQGIYETKRSAAWKALIDELTAQMLPAHAADLTVGNALLMHNPFGRGARCATVVEAVYAEDCIFDIHVEERNGCFEETGSAYIWEVQNVKVNGIWRPFELTPAERALEKQATGINAAAALVASRLG